MASPKYWVKGFWKCRGDSGFTVYVSVIGTDCLPCQRHGRPLGSPPHCLYPSSFWPSWSGTLGSQWSHCLEVQRGGCYLEPYRRGNSPPRSQVSRVGEHTLRSSPSASTSLIMSCSSASVGFCPSDLITVPSSLVVMVPSPSLSKREKASLNSGERKKCASSQVLQQSPIFRWRRKTQGSAPPSVYPCLLSLFLPQPIKPSDLA